MKFIDQINLNHIRVFVAVFRLGSMTKAAEELKLTQSGVSQHIKSLEQDLEIQLFNRFKQKIVPTALARALYTKCSSGLNELEKTLSQIADKTSSLIGRVKIGIPSEFGIHMIMPIVSDFCKVHPNLQVEFVFGLSNELFNHLKEGAVDFAYIDGFAVSKQFSNEIVFEQTFELCTTKKYLKSKPPIANNEKFYQHLEYLSYLSGGPVLNMWLKHHLSLKTDLTWQLPIRVISPAPHSILELILCNLGVGILPKHMIKKIPQLERKLVILHGSDVPLKGAISCARVPSKRDEPRPVETMREYINKRLRQNQGKIPTKPLDAV